MNLRRLTNRRISKRIKINTNFKLIEYYVDKYFVERFDRCWPEIVFDMFIDRIAYEDFDTHPDLDLQDKSWYNI